MKLNMIASITFFLANAIVARFRNANQSLIPTNQSVNKVIMLSLEIKDVWVVAL